MRITNQNFKYFLMLKKRPFHHTKKEGETQEFQVKWTVECNNLCSLNVGMKLARSWQHHGIDFRALQLTKCSGLTDDSKALENFFSTEKSQLSCAKSKLPW